MIIFFTAGCERKLCLHTIPLTVKFCLSREEKISRAHLVEEVRVFCPGAASPTPAISETCHVQGVTVFFQGTPNRVLDLLNTSQRFVFGNIVGVYIFKSLKKFIEILISFFLSFYDDILSTWSLMTMLRLAANVTPQWMMGHSFRTLQYNI